MRVAGRNRRRKKLSDNQFIILTFVNTEYVSVGGMRGVVRSMWREGLSNQFATLTFINAEYKGVGGMTE